MANAPYGVETLRKISIVWVGRTNVTDDRQTDDRQTTDRRQTDRRWHIANMNLSSRSLKTTTKVEKERKRILESSVTSCFIFHRIRRNMYGACLTFQNPSTKRPYFRCRRNSNISPPLGVLHGSGSVLYIDRWLSAKSSELMKKSCAIDVICCFVGDLSIAAALYMSLLRQTCTLGRDKMYFVRSKFLSMKMSTSLHYYLFNRHAFRGISWWKYVSAVFVFVNMTFSEERKYLRTENFETEMHHLKGYENLSKSVNERIFRQKRDTTWYYRLARSQRSSGNGIRKKVSQ